MEEILEEHGEVIIPALTGLLFISMTFMIVKVLANVQMVELERLL